jgi:hypothetical protein
MAVITTDASLDSWIANPGGNYGNGAGPRLQVGYASFSGTNGSSRTLIAFPLTGAGGAVNGVNKPITQALLKLRVRGTVGCFDKGSSPNIWVEELTSLFTENAEAGECVVDSSGASTAKWPGPTSSTTNRVNYAANPSVGSTISINITAMVEAARLAGKAILYIRIIANSETTTNDRIAFYSSETSDKPKLEVTWNPNTAPSAPTVSPWDENDTSIVTNPATTFTARVTHVDPDAGDPMTGATMEVFAAGTTQGQIDTYHTNGTGVTPLKTVTWTQTASPYPTYRDLQATGLVANTEYVYVARTRDRGNNVSDQSTWTWGAWSLLQRITTNTAPSAIQNLKVQTDTLDPHITGSVIDADPGAFIDEVFFTVKRLQDNVYVQAGKWFDVGAGLNFDVIYDGAALDWGQSYEINGYAKDNLGQIGPLLGTPLVWTPVQVFGPSLMSPKQIATLTDLLKTRSPTLHIEHTVAWDQYLMQVAYQPEGEGGLAADVVRTNRPGGSGTSLDVAWPGALPLAWAQRPSWRAMVHITGGADTQWSPWWPIGVEALPETPVFYVKDQAGSYESGLLSSVTAEVAASLLPDFRMTYVDPDRDAFGETPKWRYVEILTDANVTVAKIMRRLYHYEDDDVRVGWLHPMEQPGALTAANSGWTASGTAAVSWDSVQKQIGAKSLKIAYTALPTATVKQVQGPDTFLGSLYTDLSGVTTAKVWVRVSAKPTGLYLRIRFSMSGNDANYREYDVTPSVANAWEQKTLTLASPTAFGGTVNMAQIHGIEVQANHTAGSNQSFDSWFDNLEADVFGTDLTRKLKYRYVDQNTENVLGAPSHGDAYVLLTTSTAPVVAQVGTVSTTDPTPDIDWSVTGSQAKVQVWIDNLEADVFGTDLTRKLKYKYSDQNTENLFGAPSHGDAYVLLTTSTAPVVAQVGTVSTTDPTPDIDWSVTGSQAKVQVWIDRLISGIWTEVYDSGLLTTAATILRVPDSLLLHAATYRARVQVTSTAGLIGDMTTAQWTTAFTQLAQLTGLIATPNEALSTVDLEWTASGAGTFQDYRIYRTVNGVRVYAGTSLTPIFTDYDAPTGVPLVYDVVQWDGWMESIPAVVETQVFTVSQWWIVVPGDDTLAIQLKWVRPRYTREQKVSQGVHWPPSRSTPIVISGRRRRPVGSITVRIVADSDQLDRIRAATEASLSLPYVTLKTGWGEALQVKFGDIDEGYETAGQMEITLPFVTVR